MLHELQQYEKLARSYGLKTYASNNAFNKGGLYELKSYEVGEEMYVVTKESYGVKRVVRELQHTVRTIVEERIPECRDTIVHEGHHIVRKVRSYIETKAQPYRHKLYEGSASNLYNEALPYRSYMETSPRPYKPEWLCKKKVIE